ncbi:SH3 domain-containing protein [Isoptericola haloaureus]|uniref:SH3 domain-containing protein n=1 Tax=Isoptericola haloaureus TaxID=1542902 RepID=A0ABU7ZAF1_9MICO
MVQLSSLSRRIAALLLAAAVVMVPAAADVAVAPPADAAARPVAAPLKNDTYVLSSYYGPRCMPVRSASAFHRGQDLGAARGTDVRAVAGGTVRRAGAVRGFGQWVVVDHTIDGVRFSSLYAHLIDGDRRVTAGQRVSKGQHIGDVGSTGTSTSPHLHLEIWRGGYGTGRTVDPLRFLERRGIDLTTRSIRNYSRSVPSSCRYYTAAKVNFRTGPGTGYRVIRELQSNVTLGALPGDESGVWRKVTRSGRTGWIHRDYVSPGYTSQGTRYVLAGSLNLRSGPSTSHRVKRALPRDAKVALLRTGYRNGVWQRVRHGGTNGWVSARYLALNRDGASIVPKPSGRTYAWVDTSTLNLRSGPSASDRVRLRLRREERVRQLERVTDGWVKVRHDGRTGYVAARHLTSSRP